MLTLILSGFGVLVLGLLAVLWRLLREPWDYTHPNLAEMERIYGLRGRKK